MKPLPKIKVGSQIRLRGRNGWWVVKDLDALMASCIGKESGTLRHLWIWLDQITAVKNTNKTKGKT